MVNTNRRALVMGTIATIALFGATHQASAQLPASTTPLVITAPGVYTLTRDIRVASGDAITINASGVTLDLNGRTVSTQSAGAGRGVFVNAQTGVKIKNGKVSAFNVNVEADDSENVSITDLQIIGQNLPLSGRPSEIGVLLISSRANVVDHNQISSCSVGVFIRGPLSSGNTVSNNLIVGGADISRSVLAMCWNPLAGAAGTPPPGPKGDRVYNNHVSRFVDGLSFSPGTTGSFAFDNTFAVTGVGIRPTFTDGGNIVDDSNKVIVITP